MIARVKETGKIIELTNDEKLSMWDYARGIYRDTDGNKYHYKELEFIERPHENIDWEHRRYEIARTILPSFIGKQRYNKYSESYVEYTENEVACLAIKYADALIEELKKDKQ